eukprot:2195504-Amphidinium_carterae.3
MQSTTRASASARTSLKRKITAETTETKKQADIINNFHHVSVTNFYSASASSTEAMESTSKADDSTTTATPRAPKTSTP